MTGNPAAPRRREAGIGPGGFKTVFREVKTGKMPEFSKKKTNLGSL
jgi:hypothetical protein